MTVKSKKITLFGGALCDDRLGIAGGSILVRVMWRQSAAGFAVEGPGR